MLPLGLLISFLCSLRSVKPDTKFLLAMLLANVFIGQQIRVQGPLRSCRYDFRFPFGLLVRHIGSYKVYVV